MKKKLVLLIVLLTLGCSQNKFYAELINLKENKLKKHNSYRSHLNKCNKFIKNSNEIIYYKYSYANDYNMEKVIFCLIYDIKNEKYYLAWIDNNNNSRYEIANNLNDILLKKSINLFMKKDFAKLKESIENRDKGSSQVSLEEYYYYINTDSTSKSYKFKIN